MEEAADDTIAGAAAEATAAAAAAEAAEAAALEMVSDEADHLADLSIVADSSIADGSCSSMRSSPQPSLAGDSAVAAVAAEQDNEETVSSKPKPEKLLSSSSGIAGSSSSTIGSSAVKQRAQRKKQQQQQQQHQQQKQRQMQQEQKLKQHRGKGKQSVFTLDKLRSLFSSPAASPSASASSKSLRQQQQQQLQLKLSSVKVENLPVICLAKQLGEAAASGLTGSGCVRAAVDELVRAASERRRNGGHGGGQSLPVAQLRIDEAGVRVRQHPQSPVDGVCKRAHSIGNISYAVVDSCIERVFCFVTVDVDDQDAVIAGPVCHAFLCDSAEAAYRCVLAITVAFQTQAPPAAADSTAATSLSANNTTVSSAEKRILRLSASSFDC